MVTKGNIALYRERLNETLSSINLTDEKKLKALVKDHMLQTLSNKATDYDKIMEKRTKEVSNLLEMLRSASENYNASSQENDQASWKLKQDNEDFRVMYREGPVGSPFHSLLVEGYIDAPLDVCLCVSWETALYPRWFPETLVPTFKVTLAKTLQKIRIGEQLSLVRMKLSWPLSTREALFHYFEFEYFEGDLLVVLLNTLDPDNIKMETHGFTNECIPTPDNAVRIDAVAGFALQKVTENRSYFRTIGNLDIKLDFVPPSLINFISRQLIGSGFRFYKKTVAAVSNGDEDFSKALNDPLYSRIRQALCSNNGSERNLRKEFNDVEHKSDADNVCNKEEMSMVGNDHGYEFTKERKTISNEIEEEEIRERNGHLNEIEEEEIKRRENGKFIIHEEDGMIDCGSSNQPQLVNIHKDMPVPISPQVKKALGTLDILIRVVKENKVKHQSCSQSGPQVGGKHVKLVGKPDTSIQQNVGSGVVADGLRSENSYFHPFEAPSYVMPPDPNPANGNWSRDAPFPGNNPVIVNPVNMEANGIHENNKKTEQQKKWRLCCFHLVPGRLVS